MANANDEFSDVSSLLRAERPKDPVYCIYPHVYSAVVTEFLQEFPGRVLYAVKANPDPTVLGLIIDAGVRHFDCASLAEVELVDEFVPGAKKYFMTPVRVRGAAAAAYKKHGDWGKVQQALGLSDKLVSQLRGTMERMSYQKPYPSFLELIFFYSDLTQGKHY